MVSFSLSVQITYWFNRKSNKKSTHFFYLWFPTHITSSQCLLFCHQSMVLGAKSSTDLCWNVLLWITAMFLGAVGKLALLQGEVSLPSLLLTNNLSCFCLDLNDLNLSQEVCYPLFFFNFSTGTQNGR